MRVPSEAALSVLSSASLFLIASSGSTDRFSLLADEEMGIFVLGGPFVAGFWLRYLRIMNKAISAYKPLRTEVQKDDSFVKWIDKNIGHSEDI